MNLTEHITPGGPLLEVLRRTGASLEDEPYVYMDWTQCTCGHIYRASVGERAGTYDDIEDSRDVTFTQVLAYVARVNEIGRGTNEQRHRTEAFLTAISSTTAAIGAGLGSALSYDEARRAAALQLIRTAIATCEAEQLAAMHAVADEAQRVVSLVDVQESVMA